MWLGAAILNRADVDSRYVLNVSVFLFLSLSLSLSLQCENSARRHLLIYKPDRQLSQGTILASTLILDIPTSKSVKDKLMLLTSPQPIAFLLQQPNCLQSNQSILKEVSPEYSLEGLMLKLKLQYFGHLMWRTDSLEKTLMLAQDWRQEEKGTTEDEMIGWHHQLDGHAFEQGLGVGDGEGSLACCSPWGLKESDTTERLNWTVSRAPWGIQPT